MVHLCKQGWVGVPQAMLHSNESHVPCKMPHIMQHVAHEHALLPSKVAQPRGALNGALNGALI